MKVTYVNHMGSDISVVNAARVSFGKSSEMVCVDHVKGKYKLKDNDEKLIHYLAKHQHKSPFNHAFATFHVKAPIFVARQLQKHEYMPWNEISRRYVDSEPELYVPDVWRGRSEDKKQGSDGVVYPKTDTDFIGYTCLRVYKELLDEGVCPEQARIVLPQSMYTEWYWSGSLYAFAKMCNLRLKEDTQKETKEIALQINEKMLELFPVSWKALGEMNVT